MFNENEMDGTNFKIDLRINGGVSESPTNDESSYDSGTTQDISSSQSVASQTDAESFEALLETCGECGCWQLQIFLLTSFVGFCTALHNLIYAFIGAIPSHLCHLPNVSFHSESELKEMLIPKKSDGSYEPCLTYRYTWKEASSELIVDKSATQKCQEFDFDHSTFNTTIVTDWNLVCDNLASASAVQAMYMFGIVCGSPVFGSLSDEMGRKSAILISTIIFVLAGPLVALSPDFYCLMITRFLLAFGSPGIYETSFVLLIETSAPAWRGFVGTLFCLPFAIGYMFLPLVAYFIREWRTLQLVLSIPSLFLLLTWYKLPESPRWLLRKGRAKEAEQILRKAAKMNENELPDDFADLVERTGEKEKEVASKMTWRDRACCIVNGYVQLVKTPKMRTYTLCIFTCWAAISMTYYGIALNSPNLSTDRYLYTFIAGALEVPSYFMVPPLIRYMGRKATFSGFLFVCSVSLFLTLLMEQGSSGIVALSLFGKFVIGGAYSLVYLYATELMPTLLRTYGLGTGSMIGRIGSTVAPFIVDMLGKNNRTYPTIVFGCVSFMSGILSLFLAETRDRRLPETVEDVEKSQT